MLATLLHACSADGFGYGSRLSRAGAACPRAAVPVLLSFDHVGALWGRPLNETFGCIRDGERVAVPGGGDHGGCGVPLDVTFRRAPRGWTTVAFGPGGGGSGLAVVPGVARCQVEGGGGGDGLRVAVLENAVRLFGRREGERVVLRCFRAPHITFVSPVTDAAAADALRALPRRQPRHSPHRELFFLRVTESAAMHNMRPVGLEAYMRQMDAIVSGYAPSADAFTGDYLMDRAQWLAMLTRPRVPAGPLLASKRLHALVLVLVSHGSAANCRHAYLRPLIQAAERRNHTVDSFGEFQPHNSPPPGFPGRGDYDRLRPEDVSAYPFLWAIENANCPDYITEKLARPMLARSVPLVYAPIVDGKEVPDYASVIPRGSYINVAHFSSPAELVAYLIHITRVDPSQYEEYFWFAGHPAAHEHPELRALLRPKHPGVFDDGGRQLSCAHQVASAFDRLEGRRRPLTSATWGCLEPYGTRCRTSRIARHLQAPPEHTDFSGCALRVNVAHSGPFLGAANRTSLAGCAAACAAHPRCAAFTYRWLPSHCALLSSAGGRSARAFGRAVSGTCR